MVQAPLLGSTDTFFHAIWSRTILSKSAGPEDMVKPRNAPWARLTAFLREACVWADGESETFGNGPSW